MGSNSDGSLSSNLLPLPFTPVECRGDLEREVVVRVHDVRHDDVTVPQSLLDVHLVGVLVGEADQKLAIYSIGKTLV